MVRVYRTVCRNAPQRYVPLFSVDLFHPLEIVSYAEQFWLYPAIALSQEGEASVVVTAPQSQPVATLIERYQRSDNEIQPSRIEVAPEARRWFEDAKTVKRQRYRGIRPCEPHAFTGTDHRQKQLLSQQMRGAGNRVGVDLAVKSEVISDPFAAPEKARMRNDIVEGKCRRDPFTGAQCTTCAA